MHYYSYEVGKTLYGLAMSDVLPNNNLWRGCKYEFLLESNYDHSDGYTVEVDFPPSNWTTWQNSKYFDPRRHHYHRKWTCAIYWKHVGAQTGLTVMVEFGANKHKNPTTHKNTNFEQNLLQNLLFFPRFHRQILKLCLFLKLTYEQNYEGLFNFFVMIGFYNL